jgi:hypothetical protein
MKQISHIANATFAALAFLLTTSLAVRADTTAAQLIAKGDKADRAFKPEEAL